MGPLDTERCSPERPCYQHNPMHVLMYGECWVEEPTRYRPDAEAMALADENAERNGARPSGRPVVSQSEAIARDPENADRYEHAWEPDVNRWKAAMARAQVALQNVGEWIVVMGQAGQEAMSAFTEWYTQAGGGRTLTLAEAFDKLQTALNSRAGVTPAEALAMLMDVEEDVSSPPPPAAAMATARRRHGTAALCPIHGPTTGGLCRPCSRHFGPGRVSGRRTR